MRILDIDQFNEKLDIQPVTKERLKNMQQHRKDVNVGGILWTHDNANTKLAADGTPLKKGLEYVVFDNDYYYTAEAAMKIVPKGWSLPSSEDFERIIKAQSIFKFPLADLISTEYGGTNTIPFGAKLIGYVEVLHSAWKNNDHRAHFITSDERDEHGYYKAFVLSEHEMTFKRIKPNTACSVRFVRDLSDK